LERRQARRRGERHVGHMVGRTGETGETMRGPQCKSAVPLPGSASETFSTDRARAPRAKQHCQPTSSAQQAGSGQEPDTLRAANAPEHNRKRRA